jgi:large subunit ribosomal protein L35
MAKQKLKTHRGAYKRFGVTGSGKYTRRKGHLSHLRRKKPAGVRRLYDGKLPVHGSHTRNLDRLMPYAK